MATDSSALMFSPALYLFYCWRERCLSNRIPRYVIPIETGCSFSSILKVLGKVPPLLFGSVSFLGLRGSQPIGMHHIWSGWPLALSLLPIWPACRRRTHLSSAYAAIWTAGCFMLTPWAVYRMNSTDHKGSKQVEVLFEVKLSPTLTEKVLLWRYSFTISTICEGNPYSRSLLCIMGLVSRYWTPALQSKEMNAVASLFLISFVMWVRIFA